MVNPQENTKRSLNFFGTTYRCCASAAGMPALNNLPACSAMSSKTSSAVAIPSCPQSCPCPGTNSVSLSHDAKVFSVARHPERVVFSSRHAGYHPLASKSPVYTTFCSGTRTTMSVPECPGYDSITAATPPSSTFNGSFVEGRRSEEHTSELQSLRHLVCRLLLEKKKIRFPRSLSAKYRKSIALKNK